MCAASGTGRAAGRGLGARSARPCATGGRHDAPSTERPGRRGDTPREARGRERLPMTTSASPLPCPACRAIDRADGIEDGNLFPVLTARVKNERRIVQALKDAEDLAADRITAFAGSLRFVSLHSVWFGVWIVL